MTEEDIAWTKERIRDRLLAIKLKLEADVARYPWTYEEYMRLRSLWDGRIADYKQLWINVEKELFDE